MLAIGGVFAAWIALSAFWSVDPSQTLEAERAMLYVFALAVVLVLARRGSERPLLIGVLTAIGALTAVALVRYLFLSGPALPDRLEGYLLFRPVGYANALGALAAIGALLALGLAAHARGIDRSSKLRRRACDCRHAGLTAAAGVGCARCRIRRDARRRDRRGRALAVATVLAPGLLLAAWLCVNADLQAHTPRFKAPEARQLGVLLLVVTAVTTALARPMFAIAVRIGSSIDARHAFAASFVALQAASASWRSAAAAVRSLRSTSHSTTGRRIGSLHGKSWRAHPWTGTGAGTFAHYWLLTPHNAAQDAHSLYLEVLSELGPVGLALVVLLLPRQLWRRAKPADTARPAALAAYLAFLIHAGLDWQTRRCPGRHAQWPPLRKRTPRRRTAQQHADQPDDTAMDAHPSGSRSPDLDRPTTRKQRCRIGRRTARDEVPRRASPRSRRSPAAEAPSGPYANASADVDR